jgi:hypothetical protein
MNNTTATKSGIPVLTLGTVSIDPTDFFNAEMDTPLVRPTYEECPKPWEILPGSCVKACNQPGNLLHMVCGILVSRTAEKTIVRGHGFFDSLDETFVWTGTAKEFDQIWICD